MVVTVARTPGAREGRRRWSLLLKGGNLPLQITDGGSVRVWMSLAKSSVVGSTMGNEMGGSVWGG